MFDFQIVAVDPEGSVLTASKDTNGKITACPFEVEGIGYDFIPTVLDGSVSVHVWSGGFDLLTEHPVMSLSESLQVVDMWYKSTDMETFTMSRKLIRDEGLLCGM